MCRNAARVPSSRKSSFSTTRSDAAFSGRMFDLEAMQPHSAEAVVRGQGDRGRHDASAGDPLVDPVADVAGDSDPHVMPPTVT